MPAKRPSRAKVRSVAKALRQKAGQPVMGGKAITRSATGTGSGVIRFRASRVLDSFRNSTRGTASAKLRSSR
jgi:hypothetical protein